MMTQSERLAWERRLDHDKATKNMGQCAHYYYYCRCFFYILK